MKVFWSRIIYFIVPGIFLVAGFYLGILRSRSERHDLRDFGLNVRNFTLDPPPGLNFAGDTVPIDDPEIRERFDQELVKNVFYHSGTIMSIKRLGRWREPLGKIMKEYGIPPDFIYLCIAESQLTNVRSWRGAQGFWQFMEETAKQFGMEVSSEVDERNDPIKSTYAACRYLKQAYAQFGNWTLVAASYNMGINGVDIAIQRQKVKSYYDLHLNRETSAYIFRILAIKSVMENPKLYGFDIPPEELYSPLKFKTVKISETIPDLIQFSLDQGTNYKMLKAYNPWILGDKLSVAPGKSYRIKIPDEGEGQSEMDLLMDMSPGADTGSVPDSLSHAANETKAG